jgi:hypothetical protein
MSSEEAEEVKQTNKKKKAVKNNVLEAAKMAE